MHDAQLDALGCLAGTDKSSLGHRYLGRYGMVLRPFREAAVNVFEIGVQEGYSLALWESFFPYATIVGLDFLPECRPLERGRVKIRTGYQEDAAFLRAVAAEFPPTIVIDDGSHQASHILTSLATLWPRLLPGGVYIVEDLQFHSPLRAAANRGEPPGENPTAAVARWVQALLQDVAAEGALADVDFMLALPGAVAIGKTPPSYAYPAVLDATEAAAARIGTAVAYQRLAAYIRMNSTDLPRAERAAREAVARDPDLLDARNELANILMQGGRLADAIDVFVEAAARSPDTGWIWRQMGAALMLDRRLDEAERSLDRAVRLLPMDFWPHKHLSDVHERAGRPDRALAEARIALELGRFQMPEVLGDRVRWLERAR